MPIISMLATSVRGGSGGGGGAPLGTIIDQDDFSDGTLDHWVNGTDVVIVQDDVGVAWSAKCTYDGTSGVGQRFMSISGGISPLVNEPYLEFKSKMTGTPNSKWVKFLGNEDDSEGEANCTFSGNGDGSVTILSGNGTGTDNDTQNNYRMDGTTSGTIVGSPVFDPTTTLTGVLRNDNVWQDIRIRIKMSSSGDGIYEMWADGILKYKATGVTNKNVLNGLFRQLDFFNFSNGSGGSGTFSVANYKLLTGGWSS